MAEVVSLIRPPRHLPVKPLFATEQIVNHLIPGGTSVSEHVRFGEDVWDLTGHPSWRDKAGAATRLDFSKIGGRWRDAVKELVLLQMNPQLAADLASTPMATAWPSIQEPISSTTAQSNLKMLSHALRGLDQQNITRFTRETWDVIAALLTQPLGVDDKRATATLAPAVSRARAQQLVALWQTTHITGRQGLLGHDRPFDGRELNTVFGGTTGRRRNAVRPHESVGLFLGYSAWVLDHIAEDIVTHIEWWSGQTASEPPMSKQDLRAEMLQLAGDIAGRTGGVLPGNRNIGGGLTLAHSALARLLGVFDADAAFDAGRWVMRQLRGHVTYDDSCSPCPLPLTALPDASGALTPWTRRLLAGDDELDIWQRRLVYAAMYYLSATLMLRDSQLAVLPLDCLETRTITRPDGSTTTTHRLRAYRTKNRSVPVATTVEVNGRVAGIIRLLQRLQAALGYEPARHPLTGVPYLFEQRLATPLGKSPRNGAREGLYLDQSFEKVIREGARDLRQQGVIARDLTDVHVSMRKVRITCGQAYAVREHGQALAAAFGQWDSAAVAAGYVGDIYRIITPLEPEDTHEIRDRDIGRRIARAAQQQDGLTGNGVPRLAAAVSAQQSALSNPAPLTPARLAALGKKNRHVEQGPLTLCVYQPEGALCGGLGKPDFRLCLPGQCRNSVMTVADRARYELWRRQQLATASQVGLRAAQRMDALNPDIRSEFADHTDEQLSRVVQEHVTTYLQAELEGGA